MTEKRPLLGIALMLGSTLCFSSLDATSKYLTQTFPVPMLVWARYTVHCLLMLLFLSPSMGRSLVATKQPLRHVGRALLLVGTTGFAMAGFHLMPLAETTALLFVTPLLVALLAAWRLQEKVMPMRWLAILTGFGGMLLIARPGSGLAPEGIACMAIAALCYALYQIMTRQMAATENTLTLLFYTALVGSVAMSFAAPLYWGGPMPNARQMLEIATLGVFGGTGHLLLIRAFRYAPASLLSPLLYVQLIWSSALGWMFYGQFPDRISLVGISVIALSSASLAVSERKG